MSNNNSILSLKSLRSPKSPKSLKTLVLLTLFTLSSCADYLDIVPDNVATLDYAFRDRAGAESYLAGLYSYQPILGNPNNDPGLLGGDDTWALVDSWSGITDFSCYNIKLSQNTTNPHVNTWNGKNQGRGLFVAIRECNTFLENINKVGGDLGAAEKARFIAEAKFLKAYYHYWLLRQYGPIPLVKENMPIGASIEEAKVYRDKFDDCVDYIVALLDEAVTDLPAVIYDLSNELRRITKPVALSIKAEVLTLAASPLFNENEYLSGMVDKRGVNLMASNRTKTEKWVRAREACSEAIEMIEETNQYGLYDFSRSPYYNSYEPGIGSTSRLVMTLRTVVTDKWNREIIWGTINEFSKTTLPFFLASHVNLAASTPVVAPTIRAVETFYSENGVPIDEDKQYDYADRFNYETASQDQQYYMVVDPNTPIAKINMHREPRFYANLGFNGGYWLGNGSKVDFNREPAAQRAWVTRMLKGQPSGNSTSLRYSITGYLIKKGSHIETAVNDAGTSLTTVQSTFPIMRLADLYLLYAETLNEAENSETARTEAIRYVDRIRTRAGLKGVVESWREFSINTDKPSTQFGLRSIIHQERLNELAFEGKRFWDLRRWLTAETEMNRPVQGWNIMGETPEEYYRPVTFQILSFGKKDYLWPIMQEELLKNPNLIQNPGWQ
jgi:hypothetical protein